MLWNPHHSIASSPYLLWMLIIIYGFHWYMASFSPFFQYMSNILPGLLVKYGGRKPLPIPFYSTQTTSVKCMFIECRKTWYFVGFDALILFPLFSLFIRTLIVTLDCLDLHLYNWHIYLVSKDMYIYIYVYIKSLTSTVYIYIYTLYSPIIINNPQCLLVNIPAFPKKLPLWDAHHAAPGHLIRRQARLAPRSKRT